MMRRLLIVAAAAVAVFYGRAWRFDLHCDDMLVLRPWSWAELTGVWRGTWEPQHAWAVFFRPLAAWFYAGSFAAFGVHAAAHQLLSLLLLIAVLTAFALVVAREAHSVAVGAIAALLYAMHPNAPWSTGTWVTNDFHKLAALAALGALLCWQQRRDRPLVAWWPVVLCAVAAFLIKEDNIVLLPMMAVLQALRARWLRASGTPTRDVAILATLVVVALVCWRQLALHETGGFPWPASLEAVARNLMRGPVFVFGLVGNTPDSMAAPTLLALAVVVGVALAFRRAPRQLQWLTLVAAAVFVCYDAPLILISGATRYYMLTLAGTAILAATLVSLWAGTSRRARILLIVATAALIGVMAPRQRQALDAFARCSAVDLRCIPFVLSDIPRLPPEARATESRLAETCRAGAPPRLDEHPVLTWGLRPVASDDTSTAPVADTHVVALISTSATEARLTVRHPSASAESPVSLSIVVDGTAAASVALTTSEWTTVPLALSTNWRTWLRAAHRADLTVTRQGLEWRPLTLSR